MSQQPDPQMALQMAQQEMEYRVELFNKQVTCNLRPMDSFVRRQSPGSINHHGTSNAGWSLAVSRSAWTEGK